MAFVRPTDALGGTDRSSMTAAPCPPPPPDFPVHVASQAGFRSPQRTGFPIPFAARKERTFLLIRSTQRGPDAPSNIPCGDCARLGNVHPRRSRPATTRFASAIPISRSGDYSYPNGVTKMAQTDAASCRVRPCADAFAPAPGLRLRRAGSHGHTPGGADIGQTDRETLVALYNATDGPDWA